MSRNSSLSLGALCLFSPNTEADAGWGEKRPTFSLLLHHTHTPYRALPIRPQSASLVGNSRFITDSRFGFELSKIMEFHKPALKAPLYFRKLPSRNS